MKKMVFIVFIMILAVLMTSCSNSLSNQIDEINNKYEPFDPSIHNSYVSFKINGELYVFNDNYDGVDHDMSAICTYNNNFSIDVTDYNTNERFILNFYWEGDNAGKMYSATWYPNDNEDEEYENVGSNFIAKMNTYDLENGLVQGTFLGRLYRGYYLGSDDYVEITEGFFYIKHEFNLPTVIINNPKYGETVSGDVGISGIATDNSEILDVNVSVVENGESSDKVVDMEYAQGTNDWNLTFNSTKCVNGEYNVEVFARDKHYNYSRVKNIIINIQN